MVTTIDPSPFTTFLSVFILPFLNLIGIYTPPDPTYGRYLLPLFPLEKELDSDSGVQVRMRRVFLDGMQPDHRREAEDIHLTREELIRAKRREWVYYKLWERTDVADDAMGKGCDTVMLHGLNDYGGKWAAHIRGLLANGFRVIAPDMPSHGRSTGLHAYLESPGQLLNAVEAVIDDVQSLKAPPRKTFLIGSSMGGGVAFNYCIESLKRFRISGIYAMAPMIGVAPETMPSSVTQLIARILSPILGRLPFAKAVRGNSHNDPRVEAEFLADPRGYHGKLRISTGFTVLRCMVGLMPPPPTLRTSFKIVHGTHDRVTSHQHSLAFIASCKVNPGFSKHDQQLDLFNGYEHIMLKVGIDEKDDEMRMRVLKDMEQWVLERV